MSKWRGLREVVLREEVAREALFLWNPVDILRLHEGVVRARVVRRRPVRARGAGEVDGVSRRVAVHQGLLAHLLPPVDHDHRARGVEPRVLQEPLPVRRYLEARSASEAVLGQPKEIGNR